MKKTYLIFILTLIFSCTDESKDTLTEFNKTINLKWNKSYPEDDIEKATTGLYWSYSQLGANTLNPYVITVSNKVFTPNIQELGFSNNAKKQLSALHEKIEQSEEYTLNNSIDLGRYVALLIGSSQHYFKITGIPETLDEILSEYQLTPNKGYVNNSSVSFETRIIQYSKQDKLNQLFFCTEIDSTNGVVLEYETIEIMKNGQLKFGLFDNNGLRKNAGSPEHTRAGKPAKCMWCHESNINPLFQVQNDFEGYLTEKQLYDTLNNFRNTLTEKQEKILTGVKYNNKQDHALMELLYILFMEPSAQRLSLEWNISIEDVKNKLSSLLTHTNNEFPFLGDLYDRNDVEEFAPYKSLKVSSSVREKSEIEVNYLGLSE